TDLPSAVGANRIVQNSETGEAVWDLSVARDAPPGKRQVTVFARAGNGTDRKSFNLTVTPAVIDPKPGLVRSIQRTGRHTYFTAFSADGRYYLATGSIHQDPAQNTIRFWDVATGQEAPAVSGNEGAAFTPDGKRLLAVGLDKNLHLWDLEKRTEI